MNIMITQKEKQIHAKINALKAELTQHHKNKTITCPIVEREHISPRQLWSNDTPMSDHMVVQAVTIIHSVGSVLPVHR